MPFRHIARPRHEDVQPVFDLGGNIGQRERVQPARRQFDRQRDTVQPMAHLQDGLGILSIQIKTWLDQTGSFDK